MATDHTVGYPADTTEIDRQRPLARGTLEAAETILERLTEPTSVHIREQPTPDGEWRRRENRMFRKTWEHRHNDERVQLTTAGLGDRWRVEHQHPDGTFDVVALDVERERAYEIVERFTADLDGVSPPNRTGRAAVSY